MAEPKPKLLIDKLGVRTGSSVKVLGVSDPAFAKALSARSVSRAGRGKLDVIFFSASEVRELEALGALRARLKPDGGIWVVFPKGDARIKGTDVISAARAAGLVDNKVVAFSKTRTALRVVVPVSQRARQSDAKC